MALGLLPLLQLSPPEHIESLTNEPAADAKRARAIVVRGQRQKLELIIDL